MEVVEKLNTFIDRVDEVRSMVDSLAGRVEEVGRRVDRRAGSPVTLGRRVVESKEWRAWARGEQSRCRVEVADLEVRNTLTSTGGLVQEQRLPGVVQGATMPTDLIDVVPQIPITSNAVEIVREVSVSNNAAGVAEGGAKPESDIDIVAVTYPVRTIATWMRVSRQLVQDEPSIAAYLDSRLGYFLRESISTQMLTGTGANNLSGVFTTGNYTVYSPLAGHNALDAIVRAYHQLWASGFRADTAIVSPADWGSLKIAKGSNGHYLFAPGQLDAAAPVRVLMHPAMRHGGFLVGAFGQFSAAFVRQGITVEAFEQDANNVTQNLITIRAEVRMAFAVLRPAAFLGGDVSA